MTPVRLVGPAGDPPVGLFHLGRDYTNAKPPGERDRVARFECLDCGEVGPAAELRSHAESGACKNFRVVTTISSAGGRVLDERVEVCQI